MGRKRGEDNFSEIFLATFGAARAAGEAFPLGANGSAKNRIRSCTNRIKDRIRACTCRIRVIYESHTSVQETYPIVYNSHPFVLRNAYAAP